MSFSLENLQSTLQTPAASRASVIPSDLKALLGGEGSFAVQCFVDQRLSAKMRAFLIGYITTEVISPMSVYQA